MLGLGGRGGARDVKERRGEERRGRRIKGRGESAMKEFRGGKPVSNGKGLKRKDSQDGC